jgi:hypothetical protein
MVARALRWLAKYWWLPVLVFLAFKVWAKDREASGLRAELTGFTKVGAETVVVYTQPVEIDRPDPIQTFFKTETWDRFQEDFQALVQENERLKVALDEANRDPETVAKLEAVDTGLEDVIPWGQTRDTPRFSLTIPIPETYKLTLKPQRYRVAMVETDGGGFFAEMQNLTTGEGLDVSEFTVRRLEPKWVWNWLRWTASGGVSSEGGTPLPNVTFTGMLLSLEKHGRAYQFLGLDVDRHRVYVPLVRYVGN